MLFVLQGAALLVLDVARRRRRALAARRCIVGTVAIPGVPDAITAWIPKALVLLARLPRRRLDPAPPLAARPLDLRHRLERARRLPQRRAGRAHPDRRLRPRRPLRRDGRPRRSPCRTGIGAPIPGPYLLASVAAVVLGGVVLGGGRGGLVGPIVAVFILRLVRTDLTLLAVDPNVTTIIEGTIMVVVVMFGAFIAMRGRTP